MKLVIADDELYEACYCAQTACSDGNDYTEEDKFFLFKIRPETSAKVEQRFIDLAQNIPFVVLRQSEKLHRENYHQGRLLISSPVPEIRQKLDEQVHTRFIGCDVGSVFINIQDCTQSLQAYQTNLSNNKRVYELT